MKATETIDVKIKVHGTRRLMLAKFLAGMSFALGVCTTLSLAVLAINLVADLT